MTHNESLHVAGTILVYIIIVWFVMNTESILKDFPSLSKIPLIGTVLGFQVLIGLIAGTRVYFVCRKAKKSKIETWFHSIVVGVLVVAAPYIYNFIKTIF